MNDFRRRHWRPYKENYSVKAKHMQPRISMITGVDMLGNVYLSLTQSNSNKTMMTLFLEQLTLKLDKENSHWRQSTVITFDGASYHKATATKKTLERLRVPIMLMGPYSYEAAPCELFFAAYKADDVNPEKVPLGKTHFDRVLELVVRRCQQIPKTHLILNWHHTLLWAFKYLSFHQI